MVECDFLCTQVIFESWNGYLFSPCSSCVFHKKRRYHLSYLAIRITIISRFSWYEREVRSWTRGKYARSRRMGDRRCVKRNCFIKIRYQFLIGSGLSSSLHCGLFLNRNKSTLGRSTRKFPSLGESEKKIKLVSLGISCFKGKVSEQAKHVFLYCCFMLAVSIH